MVRPTPALLREISGPACVHVHRSIMDCQLLIDRVAGKRIILVGGFYDSGKETK